MNTTQFTQADVLGFLRDAVSAAPYDHRNPGQAEGGCQYVEATGRPSCIIGTVFHAIGLDLPAYTELDNESGISQLLANRPSLAARFDEDATIFLSEVQCQTDSGYTWAQSLTKAIEVLT